MKSILMSIQPKWVVKIVNGEKTIEVRKTAPKEVPFKVYIYCTKDKRGKIGKPSINYKTVGIWGKTFCPPSFVGFGGKVIGEFICDKVDTISVHNNTVYSVNNLFADKLKNMCLTVAELKEYLGAKNNGYAIGITALKVYDKPRELGELRSVCKYANQSSCAKCYPDNCKQCHWNVVTRPPQSWQYVETPEGVRNELHL